VLGDDADKNHDGEPPLGDDASENHHDREPPGQVSFFFLLLGIDDEVSKTAARL